MQWLGDDELTGLKFPFLKRYCEKGIRSGRSEHARVKGTVRIINSGQCDIQLAGVGVPRKVFECFLFTVHCNPICPTN